MAVHFRLRIQAPGDDVCCIVLLVVCVHTVYISIDGATTMLENVSKRPSCFEISIIFGYAPTLELSLHFLLRTTTTPTIIALAFEYP